MRKELSDILSKYRPQLVEKIDPENGILNDLIAWNVFTRRQAKSIEVLPDPYKQVEAILDMLRRRPDEDFNTFCAALRKNGQSDVVEDFLKIESNSDKDSSHRDIEAEASWSSAASGMTIQRSTKEFYDQYEAQAYPMSKNPRGRCYIFNVNSVEGMERRLGSEKDLTDLKDLFMKLYFTVDTFADPTAKDISDKIAGIVKDPHLKTDQCLVLFFLSHGHVEMEMTTRGHTAVEYIYGSDGVPIKTDDLLRPLTNSECQAMRGKPKLAFFQACRTYSSKEKFLSETVTDAVGEKPEYSKFSSEYSKFSSGAGIQESSAPVRELGIAESSKVFAVPPPTGIAESSKEFTVPPPSGIAESSKVFAVPLPSGIAESSKGFALPAPSTSAFVARPISLKDFVIGYSTESGHPSFRDTSSGSWYINAIINVFTQSVHNMDLCAMLRKVNGLIGERRIVGGSSKDSRFGGQVASHSDSLTKPYLFFFPGIISQTT